MGKGVDAQRVPELLRYDVMCRLGNLPKSCHCVRTTNGCRVKPLCQRTFTKFVHVLCTNQKFVKMINYF